MNTMTEYFPEVSKIAYEGADSKNQLNVIIDEAKS
jgi:xylose isomerase